MNYISNYITFLNEGLYGDNFKKQVLSGKAIAITRDEPIKGGVVLILSNPIFNDKKRIYMGIIHKVNKNMVTLTGNYSILKQQFNGDIMPEKIDYLSDEKRFLILNMDTNHTEAS